MNYFEKMQASGNDFIFLRESDCLNMNYSKLAVKLCDRQRSIGADGLILVKKDPLEMKIFNQDGSEASMCGNAMRCFIRLIKKWYWHDSDSFEVLCHQKRYPCKSSNHEDLVFFPHVEFADEANLIQEKQGINQMLDVYGVLIPCSVVQAGCLHTVVFDEEDLYKPFALDISKHPLFKEGCNVDFVRVISENELEVITYERGVGFTLSCGSGNVASAYAAWQAQKVSSHIRVKNRGGECSVKLEKDGVWLCGKGEFVFSGMIDLNEELNNE